MRLVALHLRVVPEHLAVQKPDVAGDRPADCRRVWLRELVQPAEIPGTPIITRVTSRWSHLSTRRNSRRTARTGPPASRGLRLA